MCTGGIRRRRGACDRLGERAIRLSPLDAMNYIPQGVIGFGNFLLGRHEGAVAAGRRAVQLNPGFSILYGWLSAPLAKLGLLDKAKVAGARLLALHPGFTISGWSAAVGIAPEMADTVANSMRLAGIADQRISKSCAPTFRIGLSRSSSQRPA
jgi:hypothetical protein